MTKAKNKFNKSDYSQVANAFAKIDLGDGFVKHLENNDRIVIESDLSASLGSRDVWRVSIRDFFGSIVVLPVYSTSKCKEDVLKDIFGYAERCVLNDYDNLEPAEKSETSSHDLGGLFESAVCASIVFIGYCTHPPKEILVSDSQGATVNINNVVSSPDMKDDLIHYSTILAANILMKKGSVAVSEGDLQKTMLTGACFDQDVLVGQLPDGKAWLGREH